MEKRKQVILIVIGIVTIIFTIAGATFVYLSLLIVKDDNISKSIIQTKTYSTLITYEQNGQIQIENATPGTTKQIQLTINNTNPSDDINYYLYWENISNNFDMTYKDFVYSLTCTSNGSIIESSNFVDKLLPDSGLNKIISKDITLGPSGTSICELEIKYLNINNIQNNNMNKSFKGIIKVGVR